MGFLGSLVDRVGSTFNLPELGLSERLGSHSTGDVFDFQGNNNPYIVGNTTKPNLTTAAPQSRATNGNLQATTGTTGGGSAGGGGGGVSAADLAFLDDQANTLRSLLGRTDTNLNQGLTRIGDQYNTEVGGATSDKERQVTNQNTQKLQTYDTINKNANTGYRSLASLIGRAAGTGSSAFRELLPDVVGKDTSSKRQNASTTFGTNLSNIEGSFQNVLADLLKQKKTNEESLRSGVESQRQSLNQQLAQTAAQKAQAQGGGYAQVKAAQAPYQAAIENSRNAVEGFFDQFRTPFTRQELSPELAQYTADRADVNARQQGITSDPYSQLLKKRQEGLV